MNDVIITPLGGLGEIGLNCQLWESGGQAVMIDCGLMFPDSNYPGIDFLVPHLQSIQEIEGKLHDIILTHGHEDHIGALPWILPVLKETRLHGSKFTLALVEHKLKEFNLLQNVELCPVNDDSPLVLGNFTFHFFPVCHSIPGGFAFGAETPAGKIIHTGDFKIDPQPMDGNGTDLELFRNFAKPGGVRLLLSDSTNVLRQGHSIMEREVKDSLDHIFSFSRGRIIVTLFSSHIQRIQEVFDIAEKYGRSVVISGKSVAANIDIASSLGYLSLPADLYNAYNGVPDLPPEKMALIVTGAQGEPLSALSRMVMGGHRQLGIMSGDTVIMSSRVIPGHTKAISRLINEMYRLGAEVYYEKSHPVHASGHAHAEELAEMIRASRPELFVPIHGEYQHLIKHARLAVQNGVAPENALCLENGQPLRLGSDFFEVLEPVETEITLVDGKGVGDIGPNVLRERMILADDGIVVASMTLDEEGNLLSEPEIISLGFIYEPQCGNVLEEAKKLMLDELLIENKPDKLKDNIRSTLRRFFRRHLERDPMVIPLVQLIKDRQNGNTEANI